MTVWERVRNPCCLRGGSKQVSLDAVIPIFAIPALAVLAAQAVYLTFLVFLLTPVLVYHLHHNFLRFLPRSKFFLMWTITSVGGLGVMFEFSVVPLLEILPEENFVFVASVLGGILCGYKTRVTADCPTQEDVNPNKGLELGEGSGEICPSCRRRTPPKAYHCRTCQTCILGREYHCRWYVLFAYLIIIINP